MEEALKLLGLGQPFLFASAAYLFFHYLDGQASLAAKKEIARWFRPLEYDKSVVANTIVDVFDKLYTKPLFGWRAFIRSAIYSVAISLLLSNFVYQWAIESFYREYLFGFLYRRLAVIGTITNILSDFASLFILRQWLLLSGHRPIPALLFGVFVGAITVLIVFVIQLQLITYWTGIPVSFSYIVTETFSVLTHSTTEEFNVTYVRLFTAFILPSVAIHLWLLLFALGILIIQAANYFLKAVQGMQWFLDKGYEHPLDAIGYVAALGVFVVASLARLIW